MIEMHIRPEPRDGVEPLRCQSRRPVRELGVLRWTLASAIVLAAALDAMWLAPARQASQAGLASSASLPPAPHYVDTPSYADMHRRRCRQQAVQRELSAAREHVRLLEAEAIAIDQAEADARERAELEARSVEVTLVRVPR
jgi:hypothetical protein